MTVEDFLCRLKGVAIAGPRKWRACCPAHHDRSPSLSVLLLDDGRILIHCFAGCAPSSVLEALGLGFADLYPSPASFHLPLPKRPWNAYDVLCALSFEVLFAWNAAKMMANGEVLSKEDMDRLLQCVARLDLGRRLVDG